MGCRGEANLIGASSGGGSAGCLGGRGNGGWEGRG